MSPTDPAQSDWRYAAFKRWFQSTPEAAESRAIKADAERQAGER